jgi:hypothetical protein
VAACKSFTLAGGGDINQRRSDVECLGWRTPRSESDQRRAVELPVPQQPRAGGERQREGGVV